MATYLAPNQHGPEDDLQAVKEIVSDDDNGSAPCGPAFAGADGLDAWGCWTKKKKKKRLNTTQSNDKP